MGKIQQATDPTGVYGFAYDHGAEGGGDDALCILAGARV